MQTSLEVVSSNKTNTNEQHKNTCRGNTNAVSSFPIAGEVLACLCVWSKVQMIAYGPADATATTSSLAPVKSGMVYLSGASLPRLS